MSQSLLCVALSLVVICNGVPQGIERPITPETPQVEGDIENYFCQLLNNCEGEENQPKQPPVTPDKEDYYPPPPRPTPSNRPPTSRPTPQTGGEDDFCQCVQYSLCNNNNSASTDEYGKDLIDIRITDEECESYLEKCCQQGSIRPDQRPTKQPTMDKKQCGNRNPDGIGFRITGNNDNEAQYAEFPWMVAVVRPDRTLSADGSSVSVYHCGGSLIHPQVVLTAAHCVNGKDGLVVRAGEWDTQTKNENYPTQDRKVSRVIVHEEFNKGTLHNDPALLILDQPLDMSMENVGLICLPEANENMDYRNCVASGWGKDLFGKEGRYQVILKRVEMPMVPRAQCLEALRKTRLGPRFKLHESFVCAGGIPGKDTCKGDGGGPLACPSKNNRNVYVQAGIVAWGINCGTETPGVYVNVPHFVNWIYNKLQAQGISLDS